MITTQNFDILDPATSIKCNLLIEASAGCGKTFAIENLVVRLLDEGFKLSEIVIVTFTKQGALDLKARIRARLEKTAPRYLKNFEEAIISTIHAFAFKLLCENPIDSQGLFLTLKSEKELYPYLVDFLELEKDQYSLDMLEELFKAYPPTSKFKNYIRGPLNGFEKIYNSFKVYLQKVKLEEEWFTYDDLLPKLLDTLKNLETLNTLRERFKIGIIDEFQDTDSLQWDLFQKLFIHDSGRIYLVGDPKQSIYRFRGAEIYTYIEALEKLGESSLRTLSTNWRSDPSLLESLNKLFDLTSKPSFLPLPKLNSFLSVPSVSAPSGKEDSPPFYSTSSSKLDGEWDKLVFFASHESKTPFIHFIAARITELSQAGVPFHEMAILVDKNSLGQEIKEFLDHCNIPAQLLRDKKETNQEVEGFLEKIQNACLNLKDDSALFEALSTPFWGWKVEDFSKLKDFFFKEKVIWEFVKLKKSLEKGPVFFTQTLLDCVLNQGFCCRQTLLLHPSGELFLTELEKDVEKEDMTLPLLPPSPNKVQILTLHISKGLEFEVVFPIGLGMRKQTNKPEPIRSEEEDAELLRLFYVALTRAKRQLFIPLNLKKAKSNQEKSAVELFFSQILSEITLDNVKSLGLQVVEAQEMDLINLSLPSVEDHRVIETALSPLPIVPPQMSLLSFTKLNVKHKSAATQIEYDPTKLPPGPATGLFLHEIFEKISLIDVSNMQNASELFSIIQPFLKNKNFEMWQDLVCELVFDAFHKPLSGLDFCLAEVEENKSFREVEFLYPHQNNYMKGVIDWIFEKDGGIYLIDWKSNWLSDYSDETLRQTLQDEGYLLQAEIYKTAAERFLIRFPGVEIKGIYFYFIRGSKGIRIDG